MVVLFAPLAALVASLIGVGMIDSTQTHHSAVGEPAPQSTPQSLARNEVRPVSRMNQRNESALIAQQDERKSDSVREIGSGRQVAAESTVNSVKEETYHADVASECKPIDRCEAVE